VIGATGTVGETIVRVLEERRVPVDRLGAFASSPRASALTFRGAALDVRATTSEALRDFDVVFFAGGEDASERFAPALVERGCVVIDNSSTFRMREGVPLVIPEVNPQAVRAQQRLFPVANCTAIILCTALAPIRNLAGLRSVHVASYQAASGAGRAGLEELHAGERAAVLGEREPEPNIFPQRLARNVVPQIGALDADGFSSEERKICAETRKMLELTGLRVTAIAVRVPVRSAHAAAVFVETVQPTTQEELAGAFERAAGIVFHPSGIVTPREAEGDDCVHVARLRSESESGTEYAFWCTGDQLRKGAATNAVQILELLLSKGFVRA